MERSGGLLEDGSGLWIDVRLTTRAGETCSLCILRELSDLSTLVAFRMRKLLSEEMSKASRIVGEFLLKLLDGDEGLFHG